MFSFEPVAPSGIGIYGSSLFASSKSYVAALGYGISQALVVTNGEAALRRVIIDDGWSKGKSSLNIIKGVKQRGVW